MKRIIIPIHCMLGKKPEFVLPEGCWIAGGAIRAWFTGKEVSNDIDVFAIDEKRLVRFVEQNKLDASTKVSKPSLDTYTHKGKPVQLIRVFSNDVDELLSKFDYTLCQFAWDGNHVYSTLEAVISTERKHLSVNEFQEGFELDSLRRAFKYAEKGFRPCLGTIRDIAKRMNRVTESSLAKQEVMSPGGNKRGIIRFD